MRHRIRFDLFPGGLPRAVTMSYDDGVPSDRRMVELLDAHGMRGTFHIHTGELDAPGHLAADELRTVFAGHEVSAHTVSHPDLTALADEMVCRELLDNRRELERLVGYPVRGLAYPYGAMDRRIERLLPGLGFEYARTIRARPGFGLPASFLRWDPSCSLGELLACARTFLDTPARKRALAMCAWGHTWTLDPAQWRAVETFCQMMAAREDVWFPTMRELTGYVEATRRMRASVDGRWLENPSASAVWATADARAIVVQPGALVDLEAAQSTP